MKDCAYMQFGLKWMWPFASAVYGGLQSLGRSAAGAATGTDGRAAGGVTNACATGVGGTLFAVFAVFALDAVSASPGGAAVELRKGGAARGRSSTLVERGTVTAGCCPLPVCPCCNLAVASSDCLSLGGCGSTRLKRDCVMRTTPTSNAPVPSAARRTARR